MTTAELIANFFHDAMHNCVVISNNEGLCSELDQYKHVSEDKESWMESYDRLGMAAPARLIYAKTSDYLDQYLAAEGAWEHAVESIRRCVPESDFDDEELFARIAYANFSLPTFEKMKNDFYCSAEHVTHAKPLQYLSYVQLDAAYAMMCILKHFDTKEHAYAWLNDANSIKGMADKIKELWQFCFTFII